MREPNGPVCPECGTPRASDGTPACSCGRLASDARRETRSAEAAAAEDFDPVRIRPFVELGDHADPDADEVPQEPSEPAAPDDGAVHTSADTAEAPAGQAPLLDVDVRPGPRRRRRTLLVTGAGATLAVLLTGAFLGGLFTYDSPSRDGSVPDDIRAPVPDGSAEAGLSGEVRPSGTSTASPSSSSTPSPSTTPADGSPTPSDASATPTPAPSYAGPTPTATAPEPSGTAGRPPVLRHGDRGPEVVELQLRLRQIGFYGGDDDGDYDRTVESAVRSYQLTRVVLADESGVYGTATRASLESETSEP
ncbi:peptidoglycan-binding protein [Streptomyces sp. HD]|uniref:peptidoglycan-binding protein n=1 Tax=Streptomyces sp. HD TaxID=3020892 RepID=UPI00232BCDCF|nr:peptidoglycan-binding protein [Streptomyces sp. HD]MDC0768981.1 peptidoglycan-binding protein [Streptomyces sp. HD]